MERTTSWGGRLSPKSNLVRHMRCACCEGQGVWTTLCSGDCGRYLCSGCLMPGAEICGECSVRTAARKVQYINGRKVIE